MKITNVTLLVGVLFLLGSCKSTKTIPYMIDAENISAKAEAAKTVYEARIVPKDILSIAINTTLPEAARPFNLGSSAGSGVELTGTSAPLQNYIVDNQGNIEFPVVGTLHVGGLTRIQAQNLIKEKIYPAYLKEEPIVNVRFKNYKISVLGEVTKPGAFTIENEQCTLLDALAMAGDLTIYGKRDNVLLIREHPDGRKETFRINLQSADFITNPETYYLQQNDVVYVQPNKTKARSSSLGAPTSFATSIVATLVSVATLIVTIIR